VRVTGAMEGLGGRPLVADLGCGTSALPVHFPATTGLQGRK
jgi:hypothetical protein